MRKIPLLTLLLLLMASSMQAYSEKIILSTFSNEANAKKSLESFKKTASYEELSGLAKKNDFKIYARESGRYHIIVIEPIRSKKVRLQAYDIVKKDYKKAYVSRCAIPKKSEPKKLQVKQKEIIKKEVPKLEKPKPLESPQKVKKENVKESKPQVALKANHEKNVRVEKKIAINDNADSIAKTIDFAMDLVSLLKYAVIFLVFAVLLYYYRKFKRIYDEY